MGIVFDVLNSPIPHIVHTVITDELDYTTAREKACATLDATCQKAGVEPPAHWELRVHMRSRAW